MGHHCPKSPEQPKGHFIFGLGGNVFVGLGAAADTATEILRRRCSCSVFAAHLPRLQTPTVYGVRGNWRTGVWLPRSRLAARAYAASPITG